MPMFFTFINTRIWWGGYNLAVAPGITRPICVPLVLLLQIWCLGKFLSFHVLTNVMIKWIWCGYEGSYDDFCLCDI